MKRASLSTLFCPACKQRLRLGAREERGPEVTTGTMLCECGKEYSIAEGIANLIYPDPLVPSDEEVKRKYDQGAAQYDLGLDWLFQSFYEDEDAVRNEMLALLDLHQGSRVLEVGCGTGKDSVRIAATIGESGELFVQDISIEMLRLAKSRLATVTTPIECFLGNAAYLPFEDARFDAVFHFGGLNTFGEIKKALAELTRVVRPGGTVVVGDEGVAPWLSQKEFGQILINANPLYRHKPPLDCLPEHARDVCLRWILGSAFYVIDYRVGDGPPRVDLDLPIPGKGGSLRSRYERSSSK